MAFTTIKWDYPTDVVFEGFRLYRNGVLRKELGTSIRETTDNVEDFNLPSAIYTITAFDNLGRESLECVKLKIDLEYNPLPAMTSDITPSGEAKFFAGNMDNISTPINTIIPYVMFNQIGNVVANSGRVYYKSNIDVNHQEMIWKYQFDNLQRITKWGIMYHYSLRYGSDTVYTTEMTVQLYGASEGNPNEKLGTLIDEKPYIKGSASGQIQYWDLPKAVKYSAYYFRFKFNIKTAPNNLTDLSLCRQLYLFDNLKVL